MKKKAAASVNRVPTQTAGDLLSELKRWANPEKVDGAARFFKSAPGEYGHGDRFLGIAVPKQREIASRFRGLSLEEIESSLQSQWHEVRLTSLFVLVHQFNNATPLEQDAILPFYLANTDRINNWDLVDSSAPQILGTYLLSRPTKRGLLHRLAASENFWEQRIALVANIPLIKNNEFAEILAICKSLLDHHHDLIHKSMGWMLRELGDRSTETLCSFLDKHVAKMPRTMLRYAIEHLPPEKRKSYLAR